MVKSIGNDKYQVWEKDERGIEELVFECEAIFKPINRGRGISWHTDWDYEGNYECVYIDMVGDHLWNDWRKGIIRYNC